MTTTPPTAFTQQKTGDDPYPSFSQAEFARRFAAVRALMQAQDLAALLLYGTITAHHEVQYLTNFPTTWESFLVFPREGEPALLLELYNHLPNARRIARVADVRWGGPDLAASIAASLREWGLTARRIGLVGAITARHDQALRRSLPRAQFIDANESYLRLRLVKSEEEIAFQRRGAELSDSVIEALEREARPGHTEHELASIAEAAYLGQGGTTNIHYMATTPMRNPAVCVPAQYHSNRVLERGDVLITEISAQYMKGYPGQILRPFTIGTPPTAAYQRLYDVAVEAFERIAGVIRAGSSVEEVLDAAEYIHTAGFTIYDDLLHSYGGGYLPPILRTRRTSVRPPESLTFEENMTIVLQPNVITEDERMGVQVGELLRVTRDGVESLHRSPMRFIRCGT
jgi:Xaa-Pro dipeptidase